MRHLLNYRRFEAFEISPTDEPEEMVAKKEINSLEKQLKEYPTVKAEIDNAFLSIKDRVKLNTKISEISKKYPGTLIDEYVRVASLLDKVKKTQEEISKYSDDVLKAKEELKDLTKSGADTGTLQAKQQTIKDIEKRSEEKKLEINTLHKQVMDAEKQMKEQLDKIKKDSVRNIDNL